VSDALETPLCDLLGIEWPILSVGFGAGAGAELTAAVSNAGGLGVLGAGGMPARFLRTECERIRELTDRPFAINLILDDEDVAYARRSVETAAECGATAAVLFWGDAAPYVRLGVKVLIQVGSVEEAEAAAGAGVDAVIAQGIEAGGHVRGTISIWELLPATVAAVAPTPVLASGGIGDGAGIARALQLGAQGVSLGTRFVASEEANVHAEYKARIVASTAADTVYTEGLFDIGWPDAPHRALRNRVHEEWEAAGRPATGSRPGEGTSIGIRRYPWAEREWIRYSPGMATADFDGDVDYAPLWAGESCSVVNDVKPAGAIVHDLVREATAALA
jgi:NAD(P)H-dependent flavin oxidoreductase YrpB (nitropropane dioxygenase family)